MQLGGGNPGRGPGRPRLRLGNDALRSIRAGKAGRYCSVFPATSIGTLRHEATHAGRVAEEESRGRCSMSPHEAMPEELLVPARTKAVIIGQGYVGLPLSMRAVEVGYDVVGYDLDLNKIESPASRTVLHRRRDRRGAGRRAGVRSLQPDRHPERHQGVRRRSHLGTDPPRGGRARHLVHPIGQPRSSARS